MDNNPIVHRPGPGGPERAPLRYPWSRQEELPLSDDALSFFEQRLGLGREAPEADVLRLLIELCAQIVGAEEGSLLLRDPEEDQPEALVFAMTVGSRKSERALLGQRVPLGEGLVGLAAVTHEVQIGAPSYEGIKYAREGHVPAGEPVSLIAAPILARDDLLGVITAVTFQAEQRFNDEHARLYARAAAVAGLVLDQARRLRALEHERKDV